MGRGFTYYYFGLAEILASRSTAAMNLGVITWTRSPSGPFFSLFWGLRFLIKLPNAKNGALIVPGLLGVSTWRFMVHDSQL